MGKGRWQHHAANCNHREPKGQQLEPETQHELSEPCALKGARTVHRGGKCRKAPTYLNLGFVGPKSEAEELKRQLEEYLRDDLKLDLSRAKTLVTHARTQTARFLGYEVHIHQNDTRRTQVRRNGQTCMRRSINGRIGLRVPERVVKEKSQVYMRQGKAAHRAELTTLSEYEIVSQYQAEYRGLVEYYQLAYNLSGPLGTLKWVMEQSLTKTLAAKLKVSVSEVYRRFKVTLAKDGKPSRGLRVVQQRAGRKPLMATWGGYP
jgi:hypothetical protein